MAFKSDNRRNKNFDPNKKQQEAKHVKNYYSTILDIADDLDGIDFTLVNKDNMKANIHIRKNGIFLNNDQQPMDETKAKGYILRRQDAFKQMFTEALKEKSMLQKYAQVIRFAQLSDDAELYGFPIKFFIYDRSKGIQFHFIIIPGLGDTNYVVNGQIIDLPSARGVFLKYFGEILYQLKTAIESAKMRQEIANGQKDEEDRKKYLSELGIKKKTTKDGRILISADSILGKKEKREADKKTKQNAEEAKRKIFGRSAPGFVTKNG